VQNDEAGSSLEVIVNQVTDGHEYLLKNFGVKPRIAWQVDPFGHSSLTPTLFSQMGYEAMVLNRIHHNLKVQKNRWQTDHLVTLFLVCL
jgi:alpha-mannosidase